MISKLGSLSIAVVLLCGAAAGEGGASPVGSFPLTTHSPESRELLAKTWELDQDEGEQIKAIAVLRKMVNIDPNFAMGHEILAQVSRDPGEQVKEQKAAWATRQYGSPAEQSVIEWFQNAADHKLIPAITDMNEVLSQYPHDKWVVFLANGWLMEQMQYDRAAAVYENSGITDSPGLLNNAAYTYASLHDYKKAFALMDKYVEMMPKLSNPEDSYGELLRLAGRYQDSVKHYQASLAINPRFHSSAYGMADTYAMMGDEVRARKIYEIAFKKFPLPTLDRVQWKTREALTYVREGDLNGADTAFQAVAEYASAHKMGQAEADTYRQMAMYQRDPRRSLELLDKAEHVIHAGQNAMRMDVDQELAQVLRTRVEAALKAGDKTLAHTTLRQLATLTADANDTVIQTAYEGASGALLFAAHKYKQSIPHLEGDAGNPLSLRLLASAYRRAGDFEGEKHINEKLASVNDPTLEQALVVPVFRKCLENPNCDSSFKTASVKR
jgi:tetratricopeptide (TPR) repeat protein